MLELQFRGNILLQRSFLALARWIPFSHYDFRATGQLWRVVSRIAAAWRSKFGPPHTHNISQAFPEPFPDTIASLKFRLQFLFPNHGTKQSSLAYNALGVLRVT